jgi:nitronate monooxygenase
MGTRFCATVEAQIHENVKRQIVEFTERDTVLVGRTLRNTARVARNAISEKVAEIQRDPTKTFDDVREFMAGVRGRENVLRDGDLDGGIWTTGQSQALIHDIPTCDELVGNIMAQANAIVGERFAAMWTARA